MGHTLVLGASGFIGGHLVTSLAHSGESVRAVARRPRLFPSAPGVALQMVDLYACSTADLRALVEGAEIIYHLAWSTFSATAEQDPAYDLGENVGFFVRLLDSLKDTQTRVVFCSSGGTVYGATEHRPISEDHPRRPLTAYGAGKVAAELYAEFFRRSYGLDVRIARLGNPYGLGQDPERLQGALTRFAAQAVNGLPIEVWGDGSVVRDYLHIDDAVEALKRLGQAPFHVFGSTPIFNVGSGVGASLNGLLDMIQTALGRPLEITYKLGRPIDVPWNVLNVDRISGVLSWRPKIALKDGVALLLDQLRYLA